MVSIATVLPLVLSVAALALALVALLRKRKTFLVDAAEFEGLHPDLVDMYKGAAGRLGPASVGLIGAVWKKIPAAQRNKVVVQTGVAVGKAAAGLDMMRAEIEKMKDAEVAGMATVAAGALAGTVKPAVKAAVKATRAPAKVIAKAKATPPGYSFAT